MNRTGQGAARSRARSLLPAAARGAAAGLLGAGAMLVTEALEQRVTRRPDSFVPGRTLMTLCGRRADDLERPVVWNHVMHWATGGALGALRGVWAAVGLRGPRADLAFTVVRLAIDQTLENATGAGAPPRTWPMSEQVVDVAHKAVYAAVTGWWAQSWIAPDLESRRGVVSH
jgi:hypothetical protein